MIHFLALEFSNNLGNPIDISLNKEVKERSGSGDSSGEEDSDDEDEGNRSQQDSSAHDEPKFYGMSEGVEDHKQ